MRRIALNVIHVIYFLSACLWVYDVRFLRAPSDGLCVSASGSWAPFFPLLLLSFRFLFDQSFRVKPGLNNTLICLRFDSLINLVVRTKVENILSHYLSDVVVDPKDVNAVFMFACTGVCKRRLHISLSAVGSSTSICSPFIYMYWLYWPIQMPRDTACAWRMFKCVRERALSHTHPLNGQFRYTGATLLCSVNNNVMAIIWFFDLRKFPLIWCVLSRVASMTASTVKLLCSCQLPLSTSRSILSSGVVCRLFYVLVRFFFLNEHEADKKSESEKTRYDRFPRV